MSKKKPPKHLKISPVKEPKKPINFGIYFAVIAVVLVIAAILISWDKFTVREIEVDGLINVDYLEVVHLSGIEYTSNLFTINLNEVSEKIEENPYLQVLFVRRKLPSTVVISVQERKPVAQIAAEENRLIVSKDMIVLGITQEGLPSSHAEVLGVKVESYELGAEVKFSKDIQARKLEELLTALENTETEDLIAHIDISFTENIKLLAHAGYEVEIGSVENIESKCLWIKTMIPKLLDENKEGGTLYITNVNTAHYIAENAE